MDMEMQGGFIIARNYYLGDQEVETRLNAVYITNEAPGLVSVSFSVEGIAEETKKGHTESQEAGKLMWESQLAFGSKQWDTAIAKYDEIIDKGLTLTMTQGQIDSVYLFRAMAYYHKKDKEGALKAFDEAITNIDDSSLREKSREKKTEVEKW
ncbi:tol-pal system YbgF family protein [candidate division KSB1 bacterium]